MAKTRPEGYPTLTPYLMVQNAAAAIDFYRQAFGAEERLRLDGPAGRIGHAELAIGDALIMLADEPPEHEIPAPGADRSVSLHLFVDDVDAMARRAVAAGARQIRPVETQFYGDRLGTFADPFGHVWHLASHVEDVAPDELKRRYAAMCAGKPAAAEREGSASSA
jgi:PhnB protein